MASVGILAGIITFNKSSGKTLSLDTFVGWSEGGMGSYGPVGGQYVTAYNTSSGLGIPFLSTVLYSGMLFGVGKGGDGAAAFISQATLIHAW
jgi:hypothetical protein